MGDAAGAIKLVCPNLVNIIYEHITYIGGDKSSEMAFEDIPRDVLQTLLFSQFSIQQVGRCAHSK
jgi:hypothetical protein